MAFFLYNAYRFSQARSARRAAEAALAQGSSSSGSKGGSAGTTSNVAGARRSAKRQEASRKGVLSTEQTLQHLQDLRARGAMSREDFLEEKRNLLGEGNQ